MPTVERGREAVKLTLRKKCFEYSLEVESLQVKLLHPRHSSFAERKEVGLRVVLEEDICVEEQEGVDHLEKLLKKRELAITSESKTNRQKVG